MKAIAAALACAAAICATPAFSGPVTWESGGRTLHSSGDAAAMIPSVTLFAVSAPKAESDAGTSAAAGQAAGAAAAGGGARAASSGPGASERVLWFSVDGAASVTGGETASTVAGYVDGAGNSANAARIRYFDESTGEEGCLDLYYYYDGAWLSESGLDVVGLDGTGGVDWQPARIASTLGAGTTLEMQVGSYSDDDETFTVLATRSGSLAELVAAGHVSTGGFGTQTHVPWTPDSFAAVPEPATLLSGLLGAAFLFRRRRAG